MDEIKVTEQNYVQEILSVIRNHITDSDLSELISDYHDKDIAGAFEELTPEERKQIYPVLGAERVSEIFSYIEDAYEYLKELNLEKAAKVIGFMDSDDAVDVLEEMDDSTGAFHGAIDLKDLIIARDFVPLETLITTSYQNTVKTKRGDGC